MLDAKPIPGSDRVVAVFSPGHGRKEHAGVVTIVENKAGPDSRGASSRFWIAAASRATGPRSVTEGSISPALGGRSTRTATPP